MNNRRIHSLLAVVLVALLPSISKATIRDSNGKSAKDDNSLIKLIPDQGEFYIWLRDSRDLIRKLEALRLTPLHAWISEAQKQSKNAKDQALSDSLSTIEAALKKPIFSGAALISMGHAPSDDAPVLTLVFETDAPKDEILRLQVAIDLVLSHPAFDESLKQWAFMSDVSNGSWSIEGQYVCWSTNRGHLDSITSGLRIPIEERLSVLGNRVRKRCFSQLSEEASDISFFCSQELLKRLYLRHAWPRLVMRLGGNHGLLNMAINIEPVVGFGGCVTLPETSLSENEVKEVLFESNVALTQPTSGIVSLLHHTNGIDYQVVQGGGPLQYFGQVQVDGQAFWETLRTKLETALGVDQRLTAAFIRDTADQRLTEFVRDTYGTWGWLFENAHRLQRVMFAKAADGGDVVAIDVGIDTIEDIPSALRAFFCPYMDIPEIKVEDTREGESTIWRVEEGTIDMLLEYSLQESGAIRLMRRIADDSLRFQVHKVDDSRLGDKPARIDGVPDTAEQQTAQRHCALPARFVPTHARKLHAFTDDLFAGRLNHATSDGKAA